MDEVPHKAGRLLSTRVVVNFGGGFCGGNVLKLSRFTGSVAAVALFILGSALSPTLVALRASTIIASVDDFVTMRGATVLTVLPTSCDEVFVAASADNECMSRLRVANEAVFLDSMATYASL